jgi:hypothetical protein
MLPFLIPTQILQFNTAEQMLIKLQTRTLLPIIAPGPGDEDLLIHLISLVFWSQMNSTYSCTVQYVSFIMD